VTVHLQPSETDSIVLTADLPNTAPDILFTYWTEPEKLTRWWPQEAALEPREGGAYTFAWPRLGWRLEGRITRSQPPRALSFTWRWTHEPGLPERQVDVLLEAQGEGTRLSVRHGPYTASAEDQKDRQGHVDGWLHFLRRLQEVTGS